jgi:pyruvate,water dikinase
MDVEWFENIRIDSRPLVGGKGASLGELTHAGIRVPPGFVVTTAAFEASLAALDRDRSIRNAVGALDAKDLARIAEVTQKVRERIRTAPLPAEVQAPVLQAYQRLCGRLADAPVAVRSSATSEDSAAASFAGLQETLLWVRGAEPVLAALRACWASLYSVESVSYRLRLGLAESEVAMGVVVQRMVDARSSGVMFTRSPTTGDPSVIAIEGSWGLGSALVSGEVTPDTFVVSKVTGDIVKRTTSIKLTEHVPDTAAQGVRTQEVSPDRQAAPCVSDAEIVKLATLAKRIEQHYGAAQDIEWAIAHSAGAAGDPDENTFLLQSRPETVWSTRRPEPIAAPKANPFDHVLAALSGKNRT